MTNIALGPAVVCLNGIVENDSWSIDITLTSGGVPFDLTGATITAKMVTATSAYVLTVVVTDAHNGKLTVSQTAAPLIDPRALWSMRINGRTIMSGSVNGTVDVLSLTQEP